MKLNPGSRFLAATVLLGSSTLPVQADDVASATDFLNSIGICTHVGQGADDPAKSAAALAYAGVQNIRDDASERHVDDWIAMHKSAGIRVVLTQSGPNETSIPKIIAMSKKLAGADALLALEGPNEPNNWAVTFNGQKSDNNTSLPIAKWQAAFYAAAKADPVLKKYPVFHSSEAGGSESDNVGLQFLTIPSGAGTLMPDGTAFADFANVHNYICRKPAIIDNMAWTNADPTFHGWTDALYVEYGKTWRKNFAGYSSEQLEKLPRVTTETGWVTGGDKGLTQEQQGRLYLNLYLAQFKRGYKHTFIYMLRDGGGSDAGYGIVDLDYRPKKAAVFLHNLSTVLSRTAAAHPPVEPISYHLNSPSPTVHELLLKTDAGSSVLVVWNEKAAGTDDVKVELSAVRSEVVIYDPTDGVEPLQTLKNTKVIQITLSDHPVILNF